MAPVIRIDDEVMDGLKKKAIHLGLIFGTPNEVLRAILELDVDEKALVDQVVGNAIEIHLNRIYTPRRWALIPISKDKRSFFPGFKVNFEFITDTGVITTHVTSAPKGTPFGDPKAGVYLQGGLRLWYNKHPELKDGDKLRIEALEPGKRYKLSIVSKGV